MVAILDFWSTLKSTHFVNVHLRHIPAKIDFKFFIGYRLEYGPMLDMSYDGGHLRFPFNTQNTHFVKNHKRQIQAKFAFKSFICFRLELFWNIFLTVY
jgi:hypothetical protein